MNHFSDICVTMQNRYYPSAFLDSQALNVEPILNNIDTVFSCGKTYREVLESSVRWPQWNHWWSLAAQTAAAQLNTVMNMELLTGLMVPQPTLDTIQAAWTLLNATCVTAGPPTIEAGHIGPYNRTARYSAAEGYR